MILLRYAFLLALGLASMFALVSATAVGGQMILAETGHRVEDPGALTWWVVAGFAGFSLFSMFRFVFAGIPTMFRDWVEWNKGKIYTLVLGGIVCAVFLLT